MTKTISTTGITIIFFIFSLLLYLETAFLIPYLSRITGVEPIVFWFIVVGLGIFLPMIIVAVIILKTEGKNINYSTWRERLRFKNMEKSDWLWSLFVIIIVGVFSFAIIQLAELFGFGIDTHPSFMSFEPLTPERYWILAVWLPYWILNIMGEEVLWRGVLLPRQEYSLGKFTWMYHGLLWGIFHLAFGWQLLLTLLPILFLLPYIVQKKKNSWIGVVIHAGINGPSFIAISFGVI